MAGELKLDGSCLKALYISGGFHGIKLMMNMMVFCINLSSLLGLVDLISFVAPSDA